MVCLLTILLIKYKCGSRCVLHELESVKEESEQINTELINCYVILVELLKIVELAKLNHFEVLDTDIIRTSNPEICLDAGISFEIKTAQHLQKRGYSGDFLLKIRGCIRNFWSI